GVEHAVIFAPVSHDIQDVIGAFDISIQNSALEALGGVAECIFMESPVIAARVDSIEESIQDGVTGLLVNSRDPVDLSKAIIRMLANPAEAALMARNAKAVFGHERSVQQSAEALEAIYQEFVQSDRRKCLPEIFQ